jgi:dipeptidyl-peptidase-4
MTRLPLCAVVLGLCGLISAPLGASEQLQQELKRIFDSKELEIKHFGPARWMDGGAAYTTLEDSTAFEGAKEVVEYDTQSGKRKVMVSASALIPPGNSKGLIIEDYDWSTDRKRLLIFTDSKKVWRANTRGDYWVLDVSNHGLHRLGGDAPQSSLMFAKFSPDGTRIAYVHGNNIYVEDVVTHRIRQITRDASATIVNGTSDWVYEEELRLRDGFRWSPDGRNIAYWQFDTSGVQAFTLLNNTDTLYPQPTLIPYPKAGTVNAAVRIGVVKAEGGATRWMDVPGDPRNNYLFRMDWAGNPEELAIGQLNRLQNHLVVYLANARTGKTMPIVEDKDDAWVDVETFGGLLQTTFEWLNGGNDLLWMSERDGWRHLYSAPRSGGTPRLVSTGNYDFMNLEHVDREAQSIYYLASPENATQTFLYRAPVSGGVGMRITPADEPGSHTYDIAPNGQWAFHTYSRADRVPVTSLIRLPEHKTVRVLEDNHVLEDAVTSLVDPPTEFLQVRLPDGTVLDTSLVKPHEFDPSKKYPLIVYVYGEPAATVVNDRWEGRRGLFHHALANEGYIIASFDNRGTPAPKGRAWRKVIYGSVGVLSSEEQAAAVLELTRQRNYVDANRIGVWGWSGGGTNTLNLMFRSAGVFKVGVAVAPVPDQKLYDTIYQERYMGLPDENVQGYHSGSAINFAEGLRGKLLVIHGSGDDNVHFQGTERLVNRLVELEKSFDFMEYPNRTHAISERKGTSFHVYSLIARYFEEHLTPGPLNHSNLRANVQ